MKSFECAIARSQIGRYLAGDSLGDEAMRQLESHITACADCQRLIEGKREELLGPLAHAPTASEAVAVEAVVEETLATSTDVAAIERELRAAAARAGRAVIETVEVREAVAVGAVPMASAASNPISSTPSGISRASAESVTSTVAGESARASALQPGRPGIGGALGRLSVPRLVRDVPEADEEGPTFNPPPAKTAVIGEPAVANTPAKANRSLTKAGVYAAALVLVLGGMAFLGDPTKLLGGKAAAAPVRAAVATKPAPKKTVAEAPALATGVRRSALGVPITDAADPDAEPGSGAVAANEIEVPKVAAKAKTLVAKAEPAATGSTASEPTEAEALMFDAATEGTTAIPAKIKSNVAPQSPVSAAPAPKATVKAKITPLKAAPTKSVRSAKPIVAKAKTSTNRVKSVGPTTSIDAVPVAPARTTTKSVVRRSRPATPRATVRKRATKRVVKRPVAPKATNVIRVYDETGKPLN